MNDYSLSLLKRKIEFIFKLTNTQSIIIIFFGFVDPPFVLE